MNERQRQRISGFFLHDSSDYLVRFECLFKSGVFADLGSRSKLLIDLLFSIECSLKALIFLESEKDEKDTYKLIKGCSHDVNKLLPKIKSEDTDFIEFKEFVSRISLGEYSISSRYSLEANICFRENGVLASKYYSTIANPAWIEALYKEAKKLKEYVSSKKPSLSVMYLSDVDNLSAYEDEIRLPDIAKK